VNFLHPYISELYYRHAQEDGSVLDTVDPTISIWSFLDIGKSRYSYTAQHTILNFKEIGYLIIV